MLTRALGIKLIETIGNGNCMIDSIRKCLERIDPDHFKFTSYSLMRKEVCRYLKSRTEEQLGSIYLNTGSVDEEVSHINSIQEDNRYTYLNVWAATALAIHYDINVMIYQLSLSAEEKAKREAAKSKATGKKKTETKKAPDPFDARIFGGEENPTHHCFLSNEVNQRGFDPRKPTVYILYDHQLEHYRATVPATPEENDEQSWAEREASFYAGREY
jgi:hypothetical protein